MHLGRLGNQVEHFLGGMAFAAAVNRTLVLPPFRTYVCISSNFYSILSYNRAVNHAFETVNWVNAFIFGG